MSCIRRDTYRLCLRRDFLVHLFWFEIGVIVTETCCLCALLIWVTCVMRFVVCTTRRRVVCVWFAASFFFVSFHERVVSFRIVSFDYFFFYPPRMNGRGTADDDEGFLGVRWVFSLYIAGTIRKKLRGKKAKRKKNSKEGERGRGRNENVWEYYYSDNNLVSFLSLPPSPPLPPSLSRLSTSWASSSRSSSSISSLLV